MPIGIVILKFDPYEGATIEFKYPNDFEVYDNYIQQIAISHNFISSILLHRDNKINALSFYNEEYKKTIIIFLSQTEDGQDYYEIIRQIDNLLSKANDDDFIKEEIKNIFLLSKSIINVKDQILLKFANELAEAKSKEDDFKRRLEKLFEICENCNVIDLKILIALTLKDLQTKNELYTTKIKGKKTEFDEALQRLEKLGLIKILKNNRIMINV